MIRSFWLSGIIAPVALLSLAASHAVAQQLNYPSNIVKIVIPSPAGADIMPRYYAIKLAEKSKGTVIVENKVGALGTIASEFVARAKPDGYTLLMTGATGTHASAKYLFKNLSYDPQKDFAPIATMTKLAFVLVINPATPAKDVKELTAYLKSKDKVSYGFSNNASQLSGELYNTTAGLKAVQVNYRSAPDVINDLLGGQLDYTFIDSGTSLELVRSGKLRGLAVTTAERSPLMAELPSMKESGLGDFDMTTWWAIFGPAGLPQPIADRVAGWINEISVMPETKEFLAKQGMEPFPGTSASTADHLAKEIPKWEGMLKAAKVERQ